MRADILLSTCISPRPFGAWKNTTQLAKYPLVIHVKPSNKMYTFLAYFYSSRYRKEYVQREDQ